MRPSPLAGDTHPMPDGRAHELTLRAELGRIAGADASTAERPGSRRPRPGTGSAGRSRRRTPSGARPRRGCWTSRPASGRSPPYDVPTRPRSALGARRLVEEVELVARWGRVDLVGERDVGDAVRLPGTDGPRGRDPRVPDGRADQPGGRRGAVHQRQDGQRPRVQHPAQAGGGLAGGGGPAGSPASARCSGSRGARSTLSDRSRDEDVDGPPDPVDRVTVGAGQPGRVGPVDARDGRRVQHLLVRAVHLQEPDPLRERRTGRCRRRACCAAGPRSRCAGRCGCCRA